MDFNSPTRNQSERTESSSSTAPSQSSYIPPPQLVIGLDQDNEKVYAIYEEPSPTIIAGKYERHFFGFPPWRFFKFPLPLRSLKFLRKRGNVMHSHQLDDETRSLPERTEHTALSPQRRSNDLGGARHKCIPRPLSNPVLANRSNASTDSPPDPRTGPNFTPYLVSSPVPLVRRLDTETAPGNTHDDGGLTAGRKSNGDNLPQASHSPSVEFFEQDNPPQAHPNLPRRCIVAELALLHATSKQVALQDVLTEFGYEGSYLIQVGFNQDMLGLNQGFLQEIYLFLESEVHPTCAERIERTLDPFPVTTYTPHTTYDYSLSEAEEEPWDLWVQHGVFCQEIRDHKTAKTLAPTDADSNVAHSTSSSSSGSDTGGRSADSDTRRNNFDSSDGDANGSNGGNSGGSDGRDQDGPDDRVSFKVEDISVRGHTTRRISIPFSSTITLPVEGERQPPTRYSTNACVEIKIEDNPDSQSPPPGQNWGLPWLEAKFTLLDAEIHATSKGKPNYHLSRSQIRIMPSGCGVSKLAYSPKMVRFDDGEVKSTVERERNIGARATLGAAPNVRIDGLIGQTTGEERSQNRWGVTSHCLPSDTNGAGEPRKTIMWKYAHNHKYYTPETQNDFEPKPSVTFGFRRTSPTLPMIEVEIVMDYSGSPPSQTFREWIADTTRLKSKKALPAYSNFLHQVSVAADLEHVKEPMECAVELDAEDRCEVSEIGTEREPIYMPLESHAGPSNCEILFRRALHGRTHLTAEQKENHRSSSLPWSLPYHTQDDGDMLGVGGLPTPSPSPTASVIPLQVHTE